MFKYKLFPKQGKPLHDYYLSILKKLRTGKKKKKEFKPWLIQEKY